MLAPEGSGWQTAFEAFKAFFLQRTRCEWDASGEIAWEKVGRGDGDENDPFRWVLPERGESCGAGWVQGVAALLERTMAREGYLAPPMTPTVGG